ncbi:histidinol dehydrogenase [Benzoatithermus flavus]|uniref:Histidinol dehydrogenase n=1 Tax=Benzoatithermus flavus TaxID=3108223 RepID=A0ABU8XMM8_9PROT
MMLLDQKQAGFADAFRALVEGRREETADVRAVVAEIIAAVRAEGDAAVLRFTERFDRLKLAAGGLRFSAQELAAARAACSPAALDALGLAAERIRAFHERQLPQDDAYVDARGVTLGLRWRPIDAVGLYVPGGTAAYPSSVLMNAIPARVAGVQRLVMVVPTPDGAVNPLVLAAAGIAGVDEIYRIGGAQAVAALAYGTAAIAPVDKIVGPGNAYVAEAKRQVFGRVGIDMIAGPSEVVVVAEPVADPAWIAADLLSQAEHDEKAQAILITDDRIFAERVAAAVEAQLAALERGSIARASWQAHGAIIVVNRLDEADRLVDALAPEHLELIGPRAEALAATIRHAGAIFMGAFTPEVIGDYVGGPNHVLPTSRTARFASGLAVYDFLKRTTLLGCDPASFRALAPAAAVLARAEGLEAHALAVERRLGGEG